MNTIENQKVFSVNGRLQAIWVESILVQAGVPVSFHASKTGAYLDVFVPVEKAYDANNILHPEHPAKENKSVFVSIKAKKYPSIFGDNNENQNQNLDNR